MNLFFSSRIRRSIMAIVLILLAGKPFSYAQHARISPGPRRGQKQFIHDTFIMPTAKPDSLTLFVYTKVSNDLLQFVLTDSVYRADYSLTVVVRDDAGESVANGIRKESVHTRDYEQTNDKAAFTKARMEFPVSPGEYTFFIEMMDHETNDPIRIEEELTVHNYFDQRFKATDLLFFHAEVEEEFTDSLPFPEIPAVHTMTDSSFSAEMFICTDGTLDTLRIVQTILSQENEPLFEKVVVDIPIRGRIQPVKFNLDKSYRFGQYLLHVQVTDGETKEEVKSPFYVRWKTHSAMLPSLAQTVETLRYIMGVGEWKELKEMDSDAQEEAIDRFWEGRDPDPTTEINELEEEYYSRIVFTNQNFSSWKGGIEGWRTDRGRIYILYGPPTDVERPITTSGNRLYYEIWYYSHLQRRFVFRDRFGVGEYRLISEEY